MHVSLPDKQTTSNTHLTYREGCGRGEALPFRLHYTHTLSAKTRMFNTVLTACNCCGLAGVFDGVLGAAALPPSMCEK